MKRLLTVAIAISMAMTTVAIAGEVKSGLEKGANPGAFQVKDVTGPSKGTSLCYRCQLGGRPVTAVFTRALNDDLASLVKEVDAIVAKNESKQAGAFVVLLSKDPDADEAKLAEFAKKHNIKKVPLTLFDGEAGPEGYNIAQDAEVTVNLWNKSKVEANHAYGKGGLSKSEISKVVADAQKMLK